MKNALIGSGSITIFEGQKFSRVIVLQIRIRTSWNRVISIEEKDITLGFNLEEIQSLLQKAGYFLEPKGVSEKDPLLPNNSPVFVEV